MLMQVGHLKTVIVLAGGFLIFNEAMPPKKLAGVTLSLAGIGWCVACAHLREARLLCMVSACACRSGIFAGPQCPECCARYSYLKMSAKLQSAKAPTAAAEADKEAAEPLKDTKVANCLGKHDAEVLPPAASLTNGHAYPRKAAP